MRLNVYNQAGVNQAISNLTSASEVVVGTMTLAGDPTQPLEVSTKSYADSKATALSISNLVDTLNVSTIPGYTGDVISGAGTGVFTLGNTGVIAGSYTKVTVDAKGRVLSGGSLTTGDIPALDWSKFTNKPTTTDGYGITDGIPLVGGTVTGNITVNNTPVNTGHAATKGYIDNAVGGSIVGYSTGDVIVRPTTTTPTGFLRCNGGQVSKTTYSSMYSLVGDSYTPMIRVGSGQPWRQQYYINTTNTQYVGTWTTGTSLPGALAYSQAIVTSNRVYLLGGINGSGLVATVYTAPINADGTLGSWTTGTSLPVTLGMSQAIVTSNRVYLLGGHNGGYASTVYTAPINADGTLGTWATGTSLPGALAYSQAIVTSNRVYLLGGFNGSAYVATVYTAPFTTDFTSNGWTTGTSLPVGFSDSNAIVTSNRVYLLCGFAAGGVGYTPAVYTAPINADGTLGTWTTGTSLPTAVLYSQPIVTFNKVHLLGGYLPSSTGYTSTVYTASINADGTLGSWTTGTSLPGALAYSQAIVTSNRVYLLGGINGSGYVATVYTAPINADGTLGTWATGTSLPGALARSQAIVTSNRVYLLGGDNGSIFVSTVYTAPINADGTLGSWTTGTSLPVTLGMSQAIVTSNRVYLLGGINGEGLVSTVYTAPINADGTLGAWTTGTSLPGPLRRSQAIVTSNRVYLLAGDNGSISVSTVYTAPIDKGVNDYSPYYNGTVGYVLGAPSGSFSLPDFSTKESAGNYYYIKY